MRHSENFSRFFTLQRNKIIIFAADFASEKFSQTEILT